MIYDDTVSSCKVVAVGLCRFFQIVQCTGGIIGVHKKEINSFMCTGDVGHITALQSRGSNKSSDIAVRLKPIIESVDPQRIVLYIFADMNINYHTLRDFGEKVQQNIKGHTEVLFDTSNDIVMDQTNSAYSILFHRRY